MLSYSFLNSNTASGEHADISHVHVIQTMIYAVTYTAFPPSSPISRGITFPHTSPLRWGTTPLPPRLHLTLLWRDSDTHSTQVNKDNFRKVSGTSCVLNPGPSAPVTSGLTTQPISGEHSNLFSDLNTLSYRYFSLTLVTLDAMQLFASLLFLCLKNIQICNQSYYYRTAEVIELLFYYSHTSLPEN